MGHMCTWNQTHSGSRAVHDILWRVEDFALHLNRLFLLVADFHPKDPEVAAS